MPKEKNRTAQTLKFLKWTKKYPDWCYLICGHENGHMNIEMMQMLIKRLAKESFFEIRFVLLEVRKNEEFMKGVSEVLSDLKYNC